MAAAQDGLAALPEDVRQHLERLRAATVDRLSRKDVARWIERNTYINGRPFSFRFHEYQERILSDPAPHRVIRKSAQTGISEAMLREAAALPMIMRGAFRVGYICPSASFASDYASTRFNPILQGSPALRAVVTSEDIDRADTKTFGSPDKVVYFKGAAVGNAAISTSLDAIVFDEYSFMSQEVAGDYQSRLLHSEYAWTTKLSTPTFPGDPICAAFDASVRHFNFCRCEHCGHRFLPSFYEHVKVPGWSGALDEITAQNLYKVNHEEAVLLCPHCGTAPSLEPHTREWVAENPDEKHIASGYQVSPFDAPRIVTVPSLIVSSTKYASKSKFRQFSLGLPDEDVENGFTDEDLEAVAFPLVNERPEGTYFMGFDQGNVCHVVVGCVDAAGTTLKAVHWERVHLSRFIERYRALKAQFGIYGTVCGDMQPNVTLSMQLLDEDPQFFPVAYVTRNGLDTFEVKMRAPDDEEGKTLLRLVNANRSSVIDRL